MSIFHSPWCRITYTLVKGSTYDVVKSGQGIVFIFGIWIEPRIRVNAGYFSLSHQIFQNDQLIRTHSWTGWTATQLPGGYSSDFWVSVFFNKAVDATYGRSGVFLYRPQVEFQGAGLYIQSEFAVAEQDHYFLIG